MSQLPPAIAIRLEDKNSFNVAMTVIEELCAENSGLRGENAGLRAGKAKLAAENKRLQAELAQLETKRGHPAKTSKNSSLPPSQETKPNGGAKGEPGTQKPQPRRAHPGAHRLLCDTPIAVKDMRTEIGPHCAADVSGVEQSEGETSDHVEIPLAPAVTTRVVLRHGICPCCCKAFKAVPPPGMEPGSPFGANLRATVLHLRHCHAVSYERTAALLDVQFGVKLSQGALASMLKAAGPAFAAQAVPIRQRLLAGTVIGSDETRFRVGKDNWWLWVFQNPDSCYFIMAPGRGKDVVEQFLDGVRPPAWVSDRLGSQAGWAEKHQACLAHLLRDAQYAIDSGDTVLAGRVIALLCRAIRVWRHRDRLMLKYGPGVLEAFFWRHFLALQEMITPRISENAVAEKFRRSLVKWRHNLFVFLTEPDVPPTNNSSEQAVRWSAVFRKVTNCFRSVWGANLHADVRSVVETARRRGIGALEAILLTLRGQPLPIPA
jgi:transposase